MLIDRLQEVFQRISHALGISYLVFIILSVLFPKVAPQYHQAIGIVPATFVNYFFNTYWTFRHSPVK